MIPGDTFPPAANPPQTLEEEINRISGGGLSIGSGNGGGGNVERDSRPRLIVDDDAYSHHDEPSFFDDL